MSDQNRQIVDYIRKQLAVGHSEAVVRQHLRASGWSAGGVDDAFRSYHHHHKLRSTASSAKATKRPKKRSGWTLRRLVKLAIALIIIGVVAVVLLHLHVHEPVAKVQRPQPLSNTARRQLDINTIAGAVGQYASATGTLPTKATVASDKASLLLCNAICDPATSQVSALTVYQAADVHIIAYSPGLATPDAQTVYLVPGASCQGNHSIGTANSRPRAMVVLYALPQDTTLQQFCVKL